MSNDQVPWDDETPPDPGLWLPIFRASPEAPARFWVVSHHGHGVKVHVVDERDRPCMGSAELCGLCDRNVLKRWKGYLVVWVEEHSRMMLLEYTGFAARLCKVDLTSKGPSLRGRQIIISRIGKHKNAPVRIEFGAETIMSEKLPDEPDVRAALRRIWGLPPI